MKNNIFAQGEFPQYFDFCQRHSETAWIIAIAVKGRLLNKQVGIHIPTAYAKTCWVWKPDVQTYRYQALLRSHKGTQLSECPQLEVVEVSISIADVHHGCQCAIWAVASSLQGFRFRWGLV